MSATPDNSAQRKFEKSALKLHSSGLATIEDNLVEQDFTEEMNLRMREKYELKIPAIDLMDLDLEKRPINPKKRQFAPLYSHCAYKSTLQQEIAIGDYTKHSSKVMKVNNEARSHMVFLIEEIHRLKEYKEETFYSAVSLADRYLVYLTVSNQHPPCLIRLAIICCLMAAKLDQPISPSFKRMARLVKKEWDVTVENKDLRDLEEHIIRVLDFSMHNISPLPFFDRYCRIFGIDNEQEDDDAKQVCRLGRQILRAFARDSSSLNFKPSQIAAAALMTALNICDSPVAKVYGLKQISGLSQKSHYFDKQTGIASPIKVGRLRPESSKKSSDDSHSSKDVSKDFFNRWNADIQRLTNKKVEKDIMPTFKVLTEVLAEREEFSEVIASLLA